MSNALKSIAIATGFLAVNISSYAYDDNDKQHFQSYINLIDESTKQGDVDPIVNHMPPTLINYMADRFDRSPEQMKAMITLMSKTALTNPELSIQNYSADLSQAVAYTSTTGREYVVFPTTTNMLINEEPETSASYILAIEEDSQWYFNRLDSEGQMKIIKQAYPDIIDLSLPKQ